MAKKRRRPRIHTMSRMAPSAAPERYTRGDVLAAMDPDTWYRCTNDFNKTMWAALAALAACARVVPSRAVPLLLADYDAGRLRIPTRHGVAYPLVLLPVVAAALDRYLALRRPLGGTHLFVTEKGHPLKTTFAYDGFRRLARAYGRLGGDVLDRLTDFFDRCFIDEKKDRLAVIVLRFGADSRENNHIPRADITAVAKDLARLERVLKRNHDLSGNPNKWLGGHGKAKAAKGARVFKRVRSIVPISDFMRTDPVCAALLRRDWRKNITLQRREICRDHLPHLAQCHEEGHLDGREVGYLLNCHSRTARDKIRDHWLSLLTPAEIKAREDLIRRSRIDIVRLFEARRPGETPQAFYDRIADEAAEDRFPFGQPTAILWLSQAGVLPSQVARRRHRRVAAE